MNTIWWITRTEFLKLTRQRFLQLGLIALSAATLALTITSPKAYHVMDPSFAVRFMQFFVMFGGLLSCSIGAMLPKALGEFSSTEIELATRTSLFPIVSARFFAMAINVVLWPAIVSITLMCLQILRGNNSLLQTFGAITLVGFISILTSLIASAFIGVFLKGALAIVASITLWCYLIFTHANQGLPAINGTIFSLVGDQYCTTVLNTEPLVSSSFDSSTWWIAPLSIILTLVIQGVLLTLTVAILGRRISK